MADQPSWMAAAGPGAAGPAMSPPRTTSGAPNAAAPTAQAGPGSPPKEGQFIRATQHFVNMGLTVMMSVSAVYGLKEIVNVKIAAFFLAVYLFIFAAALFLYELVQVAPSCRGPDATLRKNFGFFYGAKGRGFYLIFTGFLNFGLPGSFSLATGIVCICWGGVGVGLYLWKPEWFEWEKAR